MPLFFPSFISGCLSPLLLFFMVLSFPWSSVQSRCRHCHSVASATSVDEWCSSSTVPFSSFSPYSSSLSSAAISRTDSLWRSSTCSLSLWTAQEPARGPAADSSLSSFPFFPFSPSYASPRARHTGLRLRTSSPFSSSLPSPWALSPYPHWPPAAFNGAKSGRLPLAQEEEVFSPISSLYLGMTDNSQVRFGVPSSFLFASFRAKSEEAVDGLFSASDVRLSAPFATTGLTRRRRGGSSRSPFFHLQIKQTGSLERKQRNGAGACLFSSFSVFFSLSGRTQRLHPIHGAGKETPPSLPCLSVPKRRPECDKWAPPKAAQACTSSSGIHSSPTKRERAAKRGRKRSRDREGKGVGEGESRTDDTGDRRLEVPGRGGGGLEGGERLPLDEDYSRQKELMAALAGLAEEEDGEEGWYSKLRDKVLEQASSFQKQGVTDDEMERLQSTSAGLRSRARKHGDAQILRDQTGVEGAAFRERKRTGTKTASDDTIDELERLSHEEEERERLEELRL